MGFPNGICVVVVLLALAFVTVLVLDMVLPLTIEGCKEGVEQFILASARADLVRLSSSNKLSCVVFAEASCSLELTSSCSKKAMRASR